MATTAPPTGAMALLEKYSTLNNHIESARRSISEESAALETLQGTIADLRTDRRSMTDQAAKAASECEPDGRLARHLRRALRECDDRTAGRDAAQRDLDEARREGEAARRGAEESRLAFLERRREFRQACRQVRLMASAHHHAEGKGGRIGSIDTGEEYRFGSLHALLLLGGKGGDGGGDSGDDDDEYQDQDRTGGGKENGDGQQRKKRGRAATSPHRTQQPDEELLEAKSSYAEARSRRGTVASALEQIRSDHREAVRRSEDRARRLGLQRAQLDRVRADVERMERELHALERETREATAIGDGLARDADRRRRRASAGGTGAAGGQQRQQQQQQRQQQYSHPYRHNQQQRGSSFHRNFNLPEEVSEAVIDINHGGGLSSSTSSPSRRITMTPYVTQQEQQEGQGGYGGGGGANQSARSNDGGTTSSRAAAVSNPYSRNGGGYAQTQRPHQPPVNPYATSNSGDGGGGNGNDNASDDRPMNSLQRQHPHRGGRIRADRRFTTALEIFSGGTEDVDGPDRSAGPPPASVPSSASMQANSERVRKLLENDSDGDDDDDILRPIW